MVDEPDKSDIPLINWACILPKVGISYKSAYVTRFPRFYPRKVINKVCRKYEVSSPNNNLG